MAANENYPYPPPPAPPQSSSTSSAALPPPLPHPHPSWHSIPPLSHAHPHHPHPPVPIPYYLPPKPSPRTTYYSSSDPGRIAALESELVSAHREIDALRSKLADVEKERAKADTSKAQSRYWTPDEHSRFLEALRKHGPKDVRAIANYVGSRNATQVRTHSQKYFLRVARETGQMPAVGALEASRKRSMSESDLVRMGRSPPGSPVAAAVPFFNAASAAALASSRAPLSGAGGSMGDIRSLAPAFAAQGDGGRDAVSASKPPSGSGAVGQDDAMQLDNPAPLRLPVPAPPALQRDARSPPAPGLAGPGMAGPGFALSALRPPVGLTVHQPPRLPPVRTEENLPLGEPDATGMTLLSMVAREAAEHEATSSSQKRQLHASRRREEGPGAGD